VVKKKKKVETVDEFETDYEQDWEERMKNSKILEDPNLPEEVKKQYAYYESNPCIMIVSNVSSNVLAKELEEYFNTLIL
jgi:splicing factor U2AF subunit